MGIFENVTLWPPLLLWLLCAYTITFWGDPDWRVGMFAMLASGVFFSVGLATFWDWFRYRAVANFKAKGQARREEQVTAMMRDFPAVYIAEKLHGMSETQARGFLIAVLSQYQRDEVTESIVDEVVRGLGYERGTGGGGRQFDLQAEAVMELRHAMKHDGKMRPQNSVSGDERSKLQQVLFYLEKQGVITRVADNRPAMIDYEAARAFLDSYRQTVSGPVGLDVG